MKTDQLTDPTITVFLQTVGVAVAQLKQQLQQDYEQAYPELREVIHLVLDEEESRAWNLTLFPHLLLPDLVEAHVAKLNLQPGELVQVLTGQEIMATLDKQNRNRGLLFDFEMLTYCGGIYRVLRRVNRAIDEKTGKMLNMKYPCIVLEGVACRSDYHRLCPRAIYHYWRESWLKRAVDIPVPGRLEEIAEPCEKR